MTVFLFLKQIVDMFYQYKILDYGMVVFGVVLLCIKIWKDKIYLQLKEFLCPADFVVVALMLVYVAAFLRYPAAYGIFFKVESAFLIYFLGRVYGREIMQHGKVLAWAGYIAVYLNFFYRFYLFGFRLFLQPGEEDLLNRGGMYYYKTDLAVAVIIAMIFIYMFSEVKVLKWFTIIPVCGYMVLYSGARMQQAIIIAVYGFIILNEIEKRKNKRLIPGPKFMKYVSVAAILITVCVFAALEIFPFEAYGEEVALSADWLNSKIERIMHSRQAVWWGILQYFSEQPLLTKAMGIDLETEYLHNSVGIRAHSMYIKQIYATGYVGCILLVLFISNILKKLSVQEDRKLAYIVIMLWIMFLGSGLTIESIEATQMSWFPMLFAGMLFEKKVEICEKAKKDNGKNYGEEKN